MKQICDPALCTMCTACRTVCPRNCISDVHGNGQWSMQADETTCVGCGACTETCPILAMPDLKSRDRLVVAWSCDGETRKRSASGGVATEMYRYAVGRGMHICGVELDRDARAHYRVTDDPAAIPDFCNSKYTYSDPAGSFGTISGLLKKGTGVLIVALPCHAAGLLNFLKKDSCPTDSLIVVDLVCHGTPGPDYLPQHVREIEKKIGFKAGKVFFRDPKYGTIEFVFSVYEENAPAAASPKYRKRVQEDDPYQIGYHNALIYRDCCYDCRYSRHERVGDLTIFDSTGLGLISRFDLPRDNTSFVLVNTEKGARFLDDVKAAGFVRFEERPVQEAYKFNGPLNRPVSGKDSPERKAFLERIGAGETFDQAAGTAFAGIARNNMKFSRRMIRGTKRLVRKIIPRSLVDMISRMRH